MKRRNGRKRLIFLASLAVVIAAAMLLFTSLGLGTQRSGVRIGYVGHEGWSNWSASYTSFDGWMRHTIHPRSDTLHVAVETTSGAINIEMKDAKGEIIFSGSQIETSSFEVDVPGRVIVSIEADHHAGGFDIR